MFENICFDTVFVVLIFRYISSSNTLHRKRLTIPLMDAVGCIVGFINGIMKYV